MIRYVIGPKVRKDVRCAIPEAPADDPMYTRGFTVGITRMKDLSGSTQENPEQHLPGTSPVSQTPEHIAESVHTQGIAKHGAAKERLMKEGKMNNPFDDLMETQRKVAGQVSRKEWEEAGEAVTIFLFQFIEVFKSHGENYLKYLVKVRDAIEAGDRKEAIGWLRVVAAILEKAGTLYEQADDDTRAEFLPPSQEVREELLDLVAEGLAKAKTDEEKGDVMGEYIRRASHTRQKRPNGGGAKERRG